MATFLIIITSVLFVFILFVVIKRAKEKHEEVVAEKLYQKRLDSNIRKIIYFDSNLGFKPDSKQIIYVEMENNMAINQFIASHYDDICRLFATKGYNFFYLPSFVEKVNDSAFFDYHFPGQYVDVNQFNGHKFDYSFLLNHLQDDYTVKQGFIRYKMNPGNQFMFSYFELNLNSDLWQQLDFFISLVGDDLRFSLGNPENENDQADFDFWYESQQLIDEIKERVDKLRIMGVEDMLLKSLIDLKPPASSLVITADFRILLPQYNKEIVMHPLPKAIYLLFLKHPEGILFKHLSNYRKELIAIYKKMSAFDDAHRIESSIADATDPSKNAINEKCSRIREAFVKEFDDEIAQQYYITGKRAEPKRIQIDRAMVKIEAAL